MKNPIKSFFARKKVRAIIQKAYSGDVLNIEREKTISEMDYKEMEYIDQWRANAILRIRSEYELYRNIFSNNDSIHIEYLEAISNFAGRLKIKSIASVLN